MNQENQENYQNDYYHSQGEERYNNQYNRYNNRDRNGYDNRGNDRNYDQGSNRSYNQGNNRSYGRGNNRNYNRGNNRYQNRGNNGYQNRGNNGFYNRGNDRYYNQGGNGYYDQHNNGYYNQQDNGYYDQQDNGYYDRNNGYYPTPSDYSTQSENLAQSENPVQTEYTEQTQHPELSAFSAQPDFPEQTTFPNQPDFNEQQDYPAGSENPADSEYPAQTEYFNVHKDDYEWSPNLFAKLVNCIQNSVSPDVIRMGVIADIKNSNSEEEPYSNWEKVENMRRYLDSINRGLGLPNDANFLSLLQSAQWRGYGIWTMNYISEQNLDYKDICKEEQTNLSYASMVFLIALVKGMSMLNLRCPQPKEARPDFHTFLIPSQFATFSFASFLNVANARLAGKEEITAEDIEGLTNLAFKNRYWKQGSMLKGADSELFVSVLKNIISEMLGITLDIDTSSFTQQAKKEEESAAAAIIAQKAAEAGIKAAETGKSLSIATALEIVLTKYSVPQPKDVLLAEITELRPGTKEASFTSILNLLRRQEIINYYDGGLIGLKGKRYGRGHKIVNRLQRRKKEDNKD